jgi:hypothetical protein
METTRRWANEGGFSPRKDVRGDVRFSAVAEGESWGPSSFVFPIGQFYWRSSTYNNTWLSLVPYNQLYYHRGEDFGAIPDRLPIVAALSGAIVASPLPGGDGKSNGLILETYGGMRLRYAHMNIESIEPLLTVGTKVVAGQKLAKTGMTWSGQKSQQNDPHLHFGMGTAATQLSPYPLVAESYFRAYPDALAAVAGGYHLSTPGAQVQFDGSRSLARPGYQIAAYEWRLHNGQTVPGPSASVSFPAAGLYSEELVVRTADGWEDRDFAQVRVYDPNRGRKMVTGWIHYAPVRDIAVGTEILFWNRLAGTVGDVTADFGDGSPPEKAGKEIRHRYRSASLYTVAFRTQGPGDEPATVKTKVRVEKP